MASGRMISGEKEPWIAALLSFLVTGVGQMYNGQVTKGIVLLLGQIALTVATSGAAFPVLWIISIVDAALIANKLKQGQAVGEWEFF